MNFCCSPEPSGASQKHQVNPAQSVSGGLNPKPKNDWAVCNIIEGLIKQAMFTPEATFQHEKMYFGKIFSKHALPTVPVAQLVEHLC